MTSPKIADRRPAVLPMQPGSYAWCSCGLSASQPFCDGSHKGSEFRPVRVEVAEARTIAFCNCKHSAAGAMCDGAHKKLPPA